MELLKHFDTAFDAPDGIKKLRDLILALAMQGKLVPQNPDDQPASELLKEIEEEKQRLVEAGKIKQPKPLPPIKPEEVPYELAQGWEWVRLGDFLQMINGRAFKPSDWLADGLPIVRIQNLNNPRAPFNFCDESDVKEQHKINSGEFLISWSGTPGTSFGAFVWSGGKAALNQHIFKCFQIGNPYTDNFLRLAINSRLDFLISQAQGAVGLKHVTKGTLENMLLPLPPRPEQHRIVAKIDELMARCDDMEKLRSDQKQKLNLVHTSAINSLMTSKDTDSFADSWGFINRNFDDLYSLRENVAELRKTILQLAVMGKLVPQDPNVQPASDLLKQIEAEKIKLMKEWNIKTIKALPGIRGEEKPFRVPSNWEWVRLGSIANPIRGITYGIVKMEDAPANDGVFALRCSDVKYRELDLSSVRRVKKEVSKQYSRTELQGGELLLNIRGTLGGCAIAPNEISGYNIAREIAMIPLMESVENEYILNVVSSPYFTQTTINNLRGIAYKGLNLNLLSHFLIPLPPLQEQQNIVVKINQLMTLCDELEKQIDSATNKKTALLNAMVAAL